MIWQVLALAAAIAPSPERLSCGWPDPAGKVSVAVFDVSATAIEPVSEAGPSIFKNTWTLVQNSKSSLVASSAVEGSGDGSPLTLFVTTMVLNRASQEASVTSTSFYQGKVQETTTVKGSCRSIPR